MKQVVQLDSNGYFTGLTTADESPLEPGIFLIPANAIDAPVPTVPDGKRAKWNGTWVFEDIQNFDSESEIEQVELSYAENRAMEYPDFREYLDGIVKGDQAQVQAYIDACLAIKNKYPKS